MLCDLCKNCEPRTILMDREGVANGKVAVSIGPYCTVTYHKCEKACMNFEPKDNVVEEFKEFRKLCEEGWK